MQYRKKPLTVEVFQMSRNIWSKWFVDALNNGTVFLDNPKEPKQAFVKTYKGNLPIGENDYVVYETTGDIFPYKPELFEQLYEEIPI